MSFNDIDPFRKALEGVPEGLIKPAMSSLLWVIVSYPNGCYIGQEALAKQACLKHDNFTKTLRNLTKLGLIDREQTYARAGIRQCYRVNMPRLLELGRVELNTPTLGNRVDSLTEVGGTESCTGITQVDPYRDNKYYKSSNEELFDSYLSFVPAQKRFSITKDVQSIIKDLECRGTTLEAIRDDFSRVTWNSINNPRLFVLGRLRDLAARPVRYTVDSQPPKCSNSDCDPLTRTLPYFVEIPGGNGSATQYCLECNQYWVNKRNGF